MGQCALRNSRTSAREFLWDELKKGSQNIMSFRWVHGPVHKKMRKSTSPFHGTKFELTCTSACLRGAAQLKRDRQKSVQIGRMIKRRKKCILQVKIEWERRSVAAVWVRFHLDAQTRISCGKKTHGNAGHRKWHTLYHVAGSMKFRQPVISYSFLLSRES